MAGYDSLYFGKVIFDSDMLNEEDKRPYNRVKVLINGVSDITNESFNQPRAIPPAESYYNISDGFVGGMGTGTAGVNPMAAAYGPDNRSNAYKGMMSLPGVGSTVVISFMGGKRGMPIIVGVLPSGADIDSIHGVGLIDEIYPNYPVAFSNLTERTAE